MRFLLNNFKLLILILILINSSYLLYQINFYEKALNKDAYINTIPFNVWGKYLEDKKEFDEYYNKLSLDNADLLRLFKTHAEKDPKISNKIFSRTELEEPFYSNDEKILSKEDKKYFNSCENNHNIFFTLNTLPYGFYLSKGQVTKLKENYPDEFLSFLELRKKIIEKNYYIPHIVQPSKEQIKQKINNYYRVIIFFNLFLLLMLMICMKAANKSYKKEGL